jgi:hypothetical protein
VSGNALLCGDAHGPNMSPRTLPSCECYIGMLRKYKADQVA